MNAEREQLNNFLDKCLNLIIATEETTISRLFHGNLSVKEVHLIAKIGDGEKVGLNTAGDIAKSLGVTLGTLTTTTNTLIKKGLVERIKADLDKRVVRLTLTESGYDVYKKHEAFHKKLAIDVLKDLDENEHKILNQAMSIVEKYFIK